MSVATRIRLPESWLETVPPDLTVLGIDARSLLLRDSRQLEGAGLR